MKGALLLATVASHAFCNWAFAEPLVVRSGEHGEFTRIVAAIPESARWEVEQHGRLVVLEVEGMEEVIDISKVFDRISKNRISDVSLKGSRIEFQLSCDCRVAAFEQGGGLAVLDFARFDVKLDQPFVDSGSPLGALNKVVVDEFVSGYLKFSHNESPSALRHDLEPFSDDLMKELSTAASAGLLVPELSMSKVAEPAVNDTADPGYPPASERRTDETATFRTTNSLDLQALNFRSIVDNGTAHTHCPPDSKLSLRDWADERPMHFQLGEARRDLYLDLDRVDGAVAVDLAQLFIHFGFGLEAQSVLKLMDEKTTRDEILAGIASILDKRTPENAELFRSMLRCDGDIVLWSVLAALPNLEIDSFDPDAALRSLYRLPEHLGSVLGPRLAERLLELDHLEASAAALRSSQGSGTSTSMQGQIVEAKLAISEGNFGHGSQQLERAIVGSSHAVPEALVALIETRSDQGLPVNIHNVELAETYIEEMVGTPNELPLRSAHILGLIGSFQFDAALGSIGSFKDHDSGANAAALYESFFEALTRSSDDVYFLEMIIEHGDGEVRKLPVTQQLNIIRRILHLGFPKFARELLLAIPVELRGIGGRTLEGEIALVMRNPLKAISSLEDLDSRPIRLVRAMAMEDAGEYGSAHLLYEDMSLSVEARRSAWLAEDWNSRILLDDPTLSAIAYLSGSELTLSFALDDILDRGSAALAESESARIAVGTLLSSLEQLAAE
jgi:hypothetical protein